MGVGTRPRALVAARALLEVENQEFTFYLFEEIALSEGPLPVQDRRWMAGE